MHEISSLQVVSAPAALPTPAEVYAQAIAERLHSAARLRERAAQLRQAHAGAAWQARSTLLEAWADTYDRRLDTARELALRALGQCLVEGDDAGAADARDLVARHALAARNIDEARTLLQRNLALPESARSDVAWCETFYRKAVLCELAGRFDEALRWHYRHAAMAPRTGWPAEHARALAGAGGLQLSLHNTEDAGSLLATAWAIVQPRFEGWHHLWPLVAVNHFMALRLSGQLPAARAVAALVQARLLNVSPALQPKVMLMLAGLHVQAGEVAQARALLDAGRAAAGPGAAAVPPVEWVVAQAQLELQQGRAAEALRLCDAHLAAAAAGALAVAGTPMDLHLLHALRAGACRALGEEAGALAAERAAIEAERQLLGSATRAQRLTLQIRYELEAAERARDEAQQRAEAAQRERERLAEVNAALAAASLAKTRWMASASHDLRQPLQAMALQLARLKPMLGTGPARDLATRLEGAHDALRAMSDALLDLSRLDGGAVVPQRQPVPLRPLCARLVDEMAPLAEARGLRLAFHLPMRLPPEAGGAVVADSDPALLETMLRNLLDNAIKYTPRGGVVLALRPPRLSARGAAPGWRLQVRDTGPGIDEADHARAFGEFVRLGAAGDGGGDEAAARAEGLGLGLSIVQRLARLLGHAVELRSRAGRGCLFEITVAAHAGAAAGQDAVANAAGPDVAQSRQIFEAL